MPDSSNALQAAIHARLTGDATLVAMIGIGSVFDRRMTGKPMPYLVLSEIASSDFAPGLEEHAVTIEAWSDAAGRRQAQEIAARVRALLDGAALEPAGCVLVNLLHRNTRGRRQPGTKAQMVEIAFRAVTEG